MMSELLPVVLRSSEYRWVNAINWIILVCLVIVLCLLRVNVCTDLLCEFCSD